jgi:hypothetical protein
MTTTYAADRTALLWRRRACSCWPQGADQDFGRGRGLGRRRPRTDGA